MSATIPTRRAPESSDESTILAERAEAELRDAAIASLDGSASSSRTLWLRHGQRGALAHLAADRPVDGWQHAIACLDLVDLGFPPRCRRLAGVWSLAGELASADHRGGHPARDEATARVVPTENIGGRRPRRPDRRLVFSITRRASAGGGRCGAGHAEALVTGPIRRSLLLQNRRAQRAT